MNAAHLSSLFGRFVGQEVTVTETAVECEGEMSTIHTSDGDSDTVTIAMRAAAKEHGLLLRQWVRMDLDPTDVMSDRVNVSVVKGADGKWRVGSDFTIG